MLTPHQPVAPAAEPALVLAPRPTSATPVGGPFVYHDLMTPDVEAACRFYEALLGWRTHHRDVAGTPYVDLRTADRVLGGMLHLDPGYGLPAHWTGYVQVDEVDAVCARIPVAGGMVHVSPREIPDGTGRFAVAQDSTGAVFSLVAFAHAPRAPDEASAVGTPWWHELVTPDPVGAAAFYGAVLGWRAEPRLTLVDGSSYWYFRAGRRTVGGMIAMPAEMPTGVPPVAVWQLYLTVADVDEAVARALALGAELAWPATDVQGVGRVAGLTDPTGALFALGPARATAPAPAAPAAPGLPPS
jgi:predicted enzyme related to lactoylglutathione lyase